MQRKTQILKFYIYFLKKYVWVYCLDNIQFFKFLFMFFFITSDIKYQTLRIDCLKKKAEM